MRNASLDALLRHVLDYAGIFPPAQLSVADASAQYLRARRSEHGWMLGACVVSSNRLPEIDPAVMRDVPLSIVMAKTSAAAVDALLRGVGALHIDALEFPPSSVDDICAAAAAAPPAMRLFFEVPADAHVERRLDGIADAHAFAKIRTGGVAAAAFPQDTFVYRFLKACANRQLACKATAGLHHAVTGAYPLTYEPQSATATMYGFLNVCLAAVLVHLDAPEADAVALLRDSSATAIEHGDDDVAWRGYRVTPADAAATRERLFLSFGSCSVQEPIDDLTRLHLI